jgi:two-component sensor histidine kinase
VNVGRHFASVWFLEVAPGRHPGIKSWAARIARPIAETDLRSFRPLPQPTRAIDTIHDDRVIDGEIVGSRLSSSMQSLSVHAAYVSMFIVVEPFETLTLASANGRDSANPRLPGSMTSMWDPDRLRLAADAAGIALWSWNVDTGEMDLDTRSRDLCALPREGSITLDELSTRVHQGDMARVRDSLKKTTETSGRYEIDFRIVYPGGVRWVSARGEGQTTGMVGRTVFAVFLDVTPRKEAERMRDLLTEEMGHRVKNVFSIVSALATIAARSAETVSGMARDLNQRLVSLGNAHDLVRPTSGGALAATTSLSRLLAILLAPYVEEGAMNDRVMIVSVDIDIGELASKAMALIVHELATNSIKYGALSVSRGKLDVCCFQCLQDIVLEWREKGGRAAIIPPKPSGFGSKLIADCVSTQLQGSIVYDWRLEGLVVVIRIGRQTLST